MQKFSKEDLQAQAEKFMAAYGVHSFLATEDGNFFHPKDISLARDHNVKNVGGEVYEWAIDNGQLTMDNEEEEAPGPEGEKAEEGEISIDPADAVVEEKAPDPEGEEEEAPGPEGEKAEEGEISIDPADAVVEEEARGPEGEEEE